MAPLPALLLAIHHILNSRVAILPSRADMDSHSVLLPRVLLWVITHRSHSVPLLALHQDSMELLKDPRQDNSVPRQDLHPVSTVNHNMVHQRNTVVVPQPHPRWAMFLVRSPPWTCLVKPMTCGKP
jgi:hypothetical protein